MGFTSQASTFHGFAMGCLVHKLRIILSGWYVSFFHYVKRIPERWHILAPRVNVGCSAFRGTINELKLGNDVFDDVAKVAVKSFVAGDFEAF